MKTLAEEWDDFRGSVLASCDEIELEDFRRVFYSGFANALVRFKPLVEDVLSLKEEVNSFFQEMAEPEPNETGG